MVSRLILPLWIVGAIILFLYSFTQVDLSLTLADSSLFQQVQKVFQYVGWFNRPLSTYLYIGIITYLFILFGLTLKLVSDNKISPKKLWLSIIFVAAILTPSYNAFSYDLFNYIFDARIFTHYGQNPYEFRPLDFADDPMLSFMRSTHRVYPYGPSWLLVTTPLTFIANEIFLLSFFLFKILGTASFLGTAYLIGKIGKHLKLRNVNLAIALFALNPLVLIESLVSSHNEIVMMFFAVLSVYLLLINSRVFSLLSLIFSVGIKYATAVLFPIYFLKLFFKKIGDQKLIEFCLWFLILAVIVTSLASGQNKNPEFQPWYLLLAAPFVSLTQNKLIKIVFVSVSFASLLTYVPYLHNGIWPENIVMVKNVLIGVGLAFGLLAYYLLRLKK